MNGPTSPLTSGLTGTQAAVLLVLAAQVEPVRNPDLKDLGPALDAAGRRVLVERGLIEAAPGARRSIELSLTDRGWAAASELLDSPAPRGAAASTRALFTFAASIGRYLRRESLALGEVVTPQEVSERATEASPTTPAQPPETLVLAAYHRVAPSPGAWVGLHALRAALPDVARESVDEALRLLYPEPGVHIVAEDNLKALTEQDHAAALYLGGRPLHAMRVTR